MRIDRSYELGENMLSIFLFAFNVVAPIVLMILLGYGLRRAGFLNDNFLQTADRLVFRLFLPSLLFYNVYNIEGLSAIDWPAVCYALAVMVVLFALGWVVARVFVSDSRRKGVVLQCVFCANYAIIGLPLAEALGGEQGTAMLAALSVFLIPLINVLAVVSLSVFMGDQAGTDWKKVGRNILKNPMIIGIACAFVILLIRTIIPADATGKAVFSISGDLPFVYTFIGNLAKITSPLALIVLGGKFSFEAVGGLRREILLGTVWRIILAPVLGVSGAVLLSRIGLLRLGSAQYASYIALFGAPVAVSSAIMAGEMGNDGQLAGQLVVWTSVGSMFTVFLITVAPNRWACYKARGWEDACGAVRR